MPVIVPQMNHAQAAEVLSSYSLMYRSTGKNHMSYLKVFVSSCIARAQVENCPPALTMHDLLDKDPRKGVEEFLAGDWWRFWGTMLPAMIRDFLPGAMNGSGEWLDPRSNAEFCRSSLPSMTEFWAKEHDKTINSFAKTVSKTSKAFNTAWLNL